VAALSEENAASAERVASSAGEVSQHAQNVNDASAELTGIARELEGVTARFKLVREDAPGTGSPVQPLGEPSATASAAPEPTGRRRTKAA